MDIIQKECKSSIYFVKDKDFETKRDGEINADVALHSLSASRLGLQYIFKTDKALDHLNPIERYYLSVPEREDCQQLLNERSYEIDTKLKLAKREFKSGLYIEELLK